MSKERPTRREEDAKTLAKMVTGKVFFGSELEDAIADFLAGRDEIMGDADFRLGKAEGLENAVSILFACEEAGRTARLEIEHRLREMKA